MINVIGVLAAILGTLCWLPQTLKAWRSKETRDLSLSANLLILATVVLWLIYGVLLGAWPLIVANVISATLVGLIIIAKLRFG
jgi:MtN3 and saliva related transmembrane protein